MDAALDPRASAPPPLRARTPFEHRLAWRVLSFLGGVAGPALVWGWIAGLVFEPQPDYAVEPSLVEQILWRGSVVFAFAQMLGLTLWLLHRPRSPRAERVFAIVFLVGALFAAGWCLLALLGVRALLEVPEREALWRSFIGLVFLSPFVCVYVYGVNARVAWELAREREQRGEAERTPT